MFWHSMYIPRAQVSTLQSLRYRAFSVPPHEARQIYGVSARMRQAVGTVL